MAALRGLHGPGRAREYRNTEGNQEKKNLTMKRWQRHGWMNAFIIDEG